MTTTTTTTTVTVHPFEAAGLGQAPFRFVSLTQSVFCAGPGCPAQPGSSCDYCGQGIKNVCHIADRTGHQFKVGIDCVRKLNRADNRLVSDVVRAEAKRQREIRQERQRLEWQERNRRAAEAQAQREAEQRARNGGLTDAQVAERARQQAAAQTAEQNRWLLSVLDGMPGDFCESMRDRLVEFAVADLPPRCVQVLREIYGKAKGGRRGSAKYETAAAEFDTLAGIEE